jgi:peptidoglycan/LPS O-acetylase OafA/YrhL
MTIAPAQPPQPPTLAEPKTARPGVPALARERGRIGEVDALRGLAALAVVFYHYGQRYRELGADAYLSANFPGQFPMNGQPLAWVPWGRFGVQLFFMISGFVILMTITKVRSVKEFALLRFARLYPAFWVACALTFAAVQLTGLTARSVAPGASAGVLWGAALKNLTMVPRMLGAWYIDGVYWTLQQELMFYLVMAAMLAAGRARQAIWAVAALVALSLCGVSNVVFHTTPGSPEHPLVDLRWFSLFLAGMVLYDSRERFRWWHGGLLLLCVADVLRHCVWKPDFSADGHRDWEMVIADGASFALLALATRISTPILANPALVYLGTISYGLYLLHSNIGYVVMRGLSGRGVGINLAILIAIGVALGLASAVTFGVERPVCAWARRVVKKRRAAA